MKQVRWFDRKFEFAFTQNIFPSIVERLWGTPLRLRYKLSKIQASTLTAKIKGTWSIQENAGHLIDLEPVWTGRLEDVLNGEIEMRAIDLKNKKTDEANHNSKNIEDLLQEFASVRESMVSKLKELREEEVFQYALHPRLKTPMRIMDLFLFVADHDDHHLARITEIANLHKE